MQKKIYDGFLKVLTPVIHKKEDGAYLNYTKRQEELSVSKKGQYKIRGVAGAGKIYILAKRAINAHKRHLSNVLILTYNKSLKQYIRHKLNEVTDDFEHKYFHIDNYHNFIATVGNNLSLTSEVPITNI
ncbi:hypothetical protein [Sulfurovum sp.]|uniref:hypothetical protein n=1 Tax=Sulfurovum sp. TaxID=1969726 RepID=UPI0025FEA93A|nr:hypothetical protein [Sulfurovum sp.]